MAWKANGSSNDDLIEQLKFHGIINSPRTEAAMRATDRGLYSKDAELAYQDRPHSIGYGVTISAPHMHAYCLDLLQDFLTAGARALDVGSGSGYLSACMARMMQGGGKVVGIDVVEPLVKWARENIVRDDASLLETGQIVIKLGDGWKGDPENAPFDVIHVGAAAESVPQALVEQLKKGGRMIIPVGREGGSQSLLQIDKDKEGRVSQQTLMGVSYVPLVKRK